MQPKHVSYMSACITAVCSVLASSLLLLPWNHSSIFVGHKFWKVLLIFPSPNSGLVLTFT